jgi:hypothetical protein
MESRNMHTHPNDVAAFAYILYINGRYEEAIERWAKVRGDCKKPNGEQDVSTLRMSLHESKYGQEHRKTFLVQSSLANSLHIQGRFSEAETSLKSILPMMKERLGEDDEFTLSTQNSLSITLINQKKWTEAEYILNDMVAKYRREYGK